jgi:hypothetical protein
LTSAGVLVWRLTVELRRGQAFAKTIDRTAARIGGALLFALAAYVVASAGWKLWTHEGSEFSLAGLVVTVLAIPTMYFLSRQKLKRSKVCLASRSAQLKQRHCRREDRFELGSYGYDHQCGFASR